MTQQRNMPTSSPLNDNQDLSPAISLLDDLLERRAKAGAMVEEALDLLWNANRILPEGSIRSYLSGKRSSVFGFHGHDESKKELLKRLDTETWIQAIEKTNLASVLNADQLEAMKNDVRSNALPFERDIVVPTFIEQFEQRQHNFRKGLVDLFKGLQRSPFKTNKAFSVDKKIILNNALTPEREGSGWEAFYRVDLVFNDLWRFCQLCSGVDPGPLSYSEQPCHRITEARKAGETEVEFEHFTATLYKKGTVHINFTDENILKCINFQIEKHYGEALAHGY